MSETKLRSRLIFLQKGDQLQKLVGIQVAETMCARTLSFRKHEEKGRWCFQKKVAVKLVLRLGDSMV